MAHTRVSPPAIAARGHYASRLKGLRRGGRHERATRLPSQALQGGNQPRALGNPSSEVPAVYIVDDEPGTRESLSYFLGALGLRTEVFDSPRSFLKQYAPGAPGCLILDLRFPEMSGFDLLEHMHEHAIELPTLVLTGYATVALTVRAMQAGALEVIEKPYADQLLLERVQKAFAIDRDRRRARAERQAARERIERLTPREREVAAGIVCGKPTKKIAAELSLSAKTVEAHRKRVMDKSGVGSVPELVRIWDLSRSSRSRS